MFQFPPLVGKAHSPISIHMSWEHSWDRSDNFVLVLCNPHNPILLIFNSDSQTPPTSTMASGVSLFFSHGVWVQHRLLRANLREEETVEEAKPRHPIKILKRSLTQDLQRMEKHDEHRYLTCDSTEITVYSCFSHVYSCLSWFVQNLDDFNSATQKWRWRRPSHSVRTRRRRANRKSARWGRQGRVVWFFGDFINCFNR